MTRKGSPTTSVMGEHWMIDGPLFGSRDPYLYSGHHVDTHQPVVIKKLSEQASRDRALRSKFIRESKILSQLNHTNLARVIDVVESASEPAIILEHIEGESLAELLSRHGRLPAGVALEFTAQMIDGMQDLHDQGIVHRQLTPECVFVHMREDQGAPTLVITDFGLAQVEEPPGGSSGTLIGMRASDSLSAVEPTSYTPPEVLALEATPRSDVYSLIAILYHMLTGAPPIEGAGPALLGTIARGMTQDPQQTLPWASKELVELVRACLETKPARRPQDASVLMEMLLKTPEHKREAMLYIPMGSFLQGSGDQDSDARKEERPQREVELSGYYVDRTAVTSAQYAEFARLTGHELPQGWHKFNDPIGRPDFPVVYVNWHDALAYATWAQKRLLSEAEWEKAARGPSGHIFPWGDTPPTDEVAWFDEKTRPIEVGQRPRGASIYNVQDMSGNVFEWVADWYDRSYYRRAPDCDPPGPKTGKKKVLKGGSFVHPTFALRCAVRGRYAPDERRANHSFRCAWSTD